MSFVVEDGTGLANATSYIAVATADDYFTDRGVAEWVGTDPVKQGALIRATDYIDKKYGSRFLNDRLTEIQALEFPRTVFDPIMPVVLQYACAEYALRALSGPLMPDPTVDATGRTVVSSSDSVGPISTSRTYNAGSKVSLFRPYPAADMLMRSLILQTQGRVYR